MIGYDWRLSETEFTRDRGKVFECFACGGGSSFGWKLAGFDVIGCNEIDPRMMAIYRENHHPKYSFLEGIQTFKDRDDLPEEMYHLDVLSGSPPCFIAGTMVKTSMGYKPIEEIRPGDEVLTHRNRYRKVLSVMSRESEGYYMLKAEGSIPMGVTANHPFYTRRMKRVNGRTFGEPCWKRVTDLDIVKNGSGTQKEQDYLMFPINDIEIIPKWGGVVYEHKMPKRAPIIEQKKELDMASCDFWRFVGRYVGDGWLRDPRKEVIICCGFKDASILEDVITKAGFHYVKNTERTTYRYTIAKVELYEFLKAFGKGAANKHLLEEVINLPNTQLEAFLDGYLGADGHYIEKEDKWICSSVSLSLMLGIEAIVAKLYNQPCTMVYREKNTPSIEGRKVNYKPSYSVSFFKNRRKQQHSIVEDGYLCVPFRKKEWHNERVTVYNLSVAEDESYTVNNLACHNCSSFSSAGERESGWGKKKKFREGQAEQVLDTLFFDFIDLAKRLQPKVVVAENVKGILLGNARRYAERVVEGFDDAGYYVKWFLLDASKMGVPQARERVFFCCLRKDLAGPVLENDNLFEPTPRLVMEFNEPKIPVGEFADFKGDECTSKVVRELWENRKYGDGSQMDACIRLYGKHSNFGQSYIYPDKPSPTLTAHKDCLIHFEQPRYTSIHEVCCISTFPQDYNFLGQQPWYVCGMSVPCLMAMHVAENIYNQWLSRI